MKAGSQLTSDFFNSVYRSVDSIGEELESNISSTYDTSTALYNHASTMEDILTSNLSLFTNKLNSISFSYANSEVSFIESFESTEFVDKKFSVDNALTIDSLNKTLTLPEVKTTKNKVISIILEPDSNGTNGNSLNGFANADISVITSSDVQSMFEYERFASTFDSSQVELVMTLKLEQYTITNGIYIKLFSPDGIQFPIIESIDVSPDALTWSDVTYFIDQKSPKNDCYIRYLAAPTRYVRIKITQGISQYVNTGFGVKSRYSIGLREIQILTTEYDAAGDYVSIPFSTGSTISKVALETDYKSNSDLSFFLSANNGGKWLPIQPGEQMDLYTADSGVLYVENLKSVRLRIGMKRTISPTLNTLSQITHYSPNNSYTLKNKPTNLSAMIGGHLSFGDMKTYTPVLPFPYNVKKEVSNNSGLFISPASGETPVTLNFFSGAKIPYSSDMLNGTDIGSRSVSGVLVEYAKDYIKSNKNDMYVATLRYVPYFEGIESSLEVYAGGQKLHQWYYVDGVAQPTYLLIKHENSHHTYIYLDLYNIGIFASFSGNNIINAGVLNGIGVRFPSFDYTKEMNIANGKDIVLPYKSLYQSNENFTIISSGEDGDVMLVNSEDFTLLSDNKTIRISDNVYSNRVSYKISYFPAFDISELLPSDIPALTVDLPFLQDADKTSSILFTYQYQSQQSLADIKYYSPICKKYKVTLI